MRSYKPSLSKTNYNVSKEPHWWVIGKYLLVVCILVSIFFGFSFLVMPFIPYEKEVQIFRNFDFPVGEINPRQTAYVQEVFEKIMPYINNAPEMKVQVVCNEEFNVVTAPGLKIYVFSGFLQGISTEEELAFVLAHEVSHVMHRDVMRQMIRSFPLQILNLLIFEDTLDMATIDEVIGMTYGKSEELRADTEGLALLNNAYGYVGGAHDFFRVIEQYEFSPLFTAFSDHPMNSTRRENIEKLIAENGYKVQKGIPLERDLMQGCQ